MEVDTRCSRIMPPDRSTEIDPKASFRARAGNTASDSEPLSNERPEGPRRALASAVRDHPEATFPSVHTMRAGTRLRSEDHRQWLPARSRRPRLRPRTGEPARPPDPKVERRRRARSIPKSKSSGSGCAGLGRSPRTVSCSALSAFPFRSVPVWRATEMTCPTIPRCRLHRPFPTRPKTAGRALSPGGVGVGDHPRAVPSEGSSTEGALRPRSPEGDRRRFTVHSERSPRTSWCLVDRRSDFPPKQETSRPPAAWTRARLRSCRQWPSIQPVV